MSQAAASEAPACQRRDPVLSVPLRWGDSYAPRTAPRTVDAIGRLHRVTRHLISVSFRFYSANKG